VSLPEVPRLERYRPLVDDWEAFIQANLAPEPVNLRVRTGLVDPAVLDASLARQGFELARVPGLPDLRQVVRGPHSVAQTVEHWLGHFNIQQAVMSVPTLALGARPGERVLDLCAAPGGKTTHLAELMEDRGCLVAVDPKEKRLRGLMANVFRLGHTNVLVVAADGRELPGGAAFDRVLVDAPCSAEGNFRRTGGRLPKRDGKFVRYVTALQEALLRRAIELVRPGGTVVYSTCTWAPEENEAVVARVLADMPVALEPIPLELPHAPGIEAWNGREYAAELRHAWRLYPQHLDSGGAFVARLRKAEGSGEGNWGREGREGGEGGEAWGPVPEAFPGEDPGAARERIEVATALLRDRFGVDPDALAALGWMARGDNLWAETAGEWPVEGWRAHGGWRVVSHGLRAFRQAGPGREHPSTNFLVRFAGVLRSGVVELSDAELAALLDGEREEACGAKGVAPGPVAARWEGRVLGRAMVSRDGRLDLQVPKAQAQRLRALLGLDGTSGTPAD
jgi:NOL1/NOP2/sun family putative RNA methylase